MLSVLASQKGVQWRRSLLKSATLTTDSGSPKRGLRSAGATSTPQEFVETAMTNRKAHFCDILASDAGQMWRGGADPMKPAGWVSLICICVCLVSHAAATADDPDLGGADKILQQSPTLLGFEHVPNWLKFPPQQHPEWEWDGVVAGVGVDSQGNVYVSHRGNRTPKLTVWKPDGSFLRVFPGPEGNRPHFVKIDWKNDDIVWWVDDGDDCIYKLDQSGDVLMTLGEPGVTGADHYHYSGVTDIDWDSRGYLYVTDGDRKNRRVLKYDSKGRFIKTWGSEGQERGQFDYPHGIMVDSRDRVLVCDLNNWRVQVFDTNGNLLDNWTHLGRIYEMVEGHHGDFYACDGTTGRITRVTPDGIVVGFIHKPTQARGGLQNAFSLAICPNGDLVVGMHQGWVERWRAPSNNVN